MNPFLGVFFHWLGGFASGSFYVPYRFVKKWSWEVYWLCGGFMSWIIAPWILAFLLTKGLIPTITATWHIDPGSIRWAFLFGMMWGVGGLTFGLTMRYLGMSLGMAVALGYCTVLGALMPPIFQGEFSTILSTHAGWINLFGLGVCVLGIALAGAAGLSKESEMSDEAKRESIKEFSFVKGMIVATISGVFSAGMSYAMSAAEPLSVSSKYFGTDELWTGLPKLCVILLGGFLTNFLWCLFLLIKNGTLYQYCSRFIKSEYTVAAGGTEKVLKEGVKPVSLFRNYFFSMLAGLTWYMQFFFYSMGETQMGSFKFSSWTIHMASIIVFSSLWGIALAEWKGTSRLTKTLLFLAIGTLLYSTLLVGYSNYMNANADREASAVVAISSVEEQGEVITTEAQTNLSRTLSKIDPYTGKEIETPDSEYVVYTSLTPEQAQKHRDRFAAAQDKKKITEEKRAEVQKKLQELYPSNQLTTTPTEE